jgi:hypothetical protein
MSFTAAGDRSIRTAVKARRFFESLSLVLVLIMASASEFVMLFGLLLALVQKRGYSRFI